MGWDWGKKLGGAPSAPAPAPNPNLPRGMGVDHGRVIDHYMENRQPAPGGYQQPWQQGQPPPPAPPPETYTPPDPKDPMGHMRNVWTFQGNFKDGAAKESSAMGNCPSCGSARFFSRANGGWSVTTDHGIFYPAPECIDCGYPREQGMVAGASVTSAPAMASRSAGAAPPAGSIPFIKN